MTGIRTTAFRGMAPRFNKRRLADNLAQVATNCKIGSGGLVPYKMPATVSTPGGGTATERPRFTVTVSGG